MFWEKSGPRGALSKKIGRTIRALEETKMRSPRLSFPGAVLRLVLGVAGVLDAVGILAFYQRPRQSSMRWIHV
jgi:hypothetical protein